MSSLPLHVLSECIYWFLDIDPSCFVFNFIFFQIPICKFLESTKKYGRVQMTFRSIAQCKC